MMSDDALQVLLSAMEIAAFERTVDGSFMALTPPPAWFPRLANVSFPFLGHILDEANAFWLSGKPGKQNWGPAAETDDSGREFHYMVSAITAGGKQYLLFQIDRGSDRVREVLQTVRDQKLHQEQAQRARAALASHVREKSEELYSVIGRLATGPVAPGQRELFDKLSAACDALVGAANRLT